MALLKKNLYYTKREIYSTLKLSTSDKKIIQSYYKVLPRKLLGFAFSKNPSRPCPSPTWHVHLLWSLRFPQSEKETYVLLFTRGFKLCTSNPFFLPFQFFFSISPSSSSSNLQMLLQQSIDDQITHICSLRIEEPPWCGQRLYEGVWHRSKQPLQSCLVDAQGFASTPHAVSDPFG